MRVKKVRPSSSRMSVPTMPPVRVEKPAQPSGASLFPAGFNPLAGLKGLKKTTSVPEESGEDTPPVVSHGHGMHLPKFDPAAMLKGLKSTKKDTPEEASSTVEPEPVQKGPLGGFNPAAALKGLKSTKKPVSGETPPQPSLGGFNPAAALKGLRSTKKDTQE
jgi:hypothetical protein